MKRVSQSGSISLSAIIAVTMSILFVGAIAFGVWAFAGRQDYKTNSDKKVDAAVEVAKKQTQTADDNKFAEAEKSPVKSFNGSPTYGTVSFNYPKTYSAYSAETTNSSTPLDSYFHPNVVPSVAGGTSFALRTQVVETSYANVLKEFDSKTKNGKVTVAAFRAAKVPDTLGVRIDGEIATGKQGSLILLPLRDKTLKIWTESDDYRNDFNTFVVPSISFVP